MTLPIARTKPALESNTNMINTKGILYGFWKNTSIFTKFSLSEAKIALRYLLQDGPNDKVVKKFEDRFANYIGSKYAVMVPSARYGFYLLLRAFGVKEGDEVIIPGLTYFAIPAYGTPCGSKAYICRYWFTQPCFGSRCF